MPRKKVSIKNIEELRDFLIDSIEKLDKREIDVVTAKQQANLAGKVIKTAALQMEYHKMTKKESEIGFMEC